MSVDIPVSAVIVTLNEEQNLPRCLSALERFGEIVVVDSGSADATRIIANARCARVINFQWNGQYPKKRQWCLDNLDLKYDRVLFIDADEEMTPELADEIAALDWKCTGYFIDGLYVVRGKKLKFGMRNRKLCLFDRRYLEFPVVDDLDIAGMGEIEGHYQPVLKKDAGAQAIRRLKSPLLHHAYEDIERWEARHDGYAVWEKGMIERGAYPVEATGLRSVLKSAFRAVPFRGSLFFLYYYVMKGGFIGGKAARDLTAQKKKYYDRI